jgi:hypothetical protein
MQYPTIMPKGYDPRHPQALWRRHGRDDMITRRASGWVI